MATVSVDNQLQVGMAQACHGAGIGVHDAKQRTYSARQRGVNLIDAGVPQVMAMKIGG